MTKKNKARKPNKQTGPGRNEAVPGFPDSRHPADAIAWWRDSLRGGFSPVGAAEHLNACLANSAGTDLASAFAAMLELAALPLADTNLAVALKGAPLAALLDPDSSRLLVADAAFGGLACNSLDTGRAIWEVEPEGAAQVRGMALLDNMLIYCDTWQNRVVALDATDGTCLWETGEARDGRPLTAPSAVVPVEVESGRELWVADYAGHRICRFTLDGAPLGSIGRRGLTAEETAHNFTRKKGTPRQVYFEFPFSLNTGVDSDGARAIFVWDWWNGRVQVLSPDGRLLRQIQLEMPPGISGRFAGQVTVVSGPSSLLIFGIDDTACSLLIWSAYGELLINVKLRELIFGDSGRAERVRLCNAPSGVTALYLLATDGRLYRLDDRFLDPHRLLESLTAVYPDSPRMALVRAGLPGGFILGDTVLSVNWKAVSPRMSEEAFVDELVKCEEALGGSLETNVRRIAALAVDLERAGDAESAVSLRTALQSRLTALATGLVEQVERLANHEGSEPTLWAEAMTEVDMELFKYRGRSSSRQVSLDLEIDRSREIAPRIRNTSWQLRVLLAVMAEHLSAEPVGGILSTLISACCRLLESRIAMLQWLDRSVSYDKPPQQVAKNELRQINLGLVRSRAVEMAADRLADEIARLVELKPELLTADLRRQLDGCAGLATGLEASRSIERILGGANLHPASALKKQSGLFRREARGELKELVANMQSYLDEVEKTTELGSHFDKVLARQKVIFAIKVSLLSNQLPVNGFRSHDTLMVIERARAMAGGEAWKECRSLRIENGCEVQ